MLPSLLPSLLPSFLPLQIKALNVLGDPLLGFESGNQSSFPWLDFGWFCCFALLCFALAHAFALVGTHTLHHPHKQLSTLQHYTGFRNMECWVCSEEKGGIGNGEKRVGNWHQINERIEMIKKHSSFSTSSPLNLRSTQMLLLQTCYPLNLRSTQMLLLQTCYPLNLRSTQMLLLQTCYPLNLRSTQMLLLQTCYLIPSSCLI